MPNNTTKHQHYPQTPTATLMANRQNTTHTQQQSEDKISYRNYYESMILSIPFQPNMVYLDSPRHPKSQKPRLLPLSFSFTHISFIFNHQVLQRKTSSRNPAPKPSRKPAIITQMICSFQSCSAKNTEHYHKSRISGQNNVLAEAYTVHILQGTLPIVAPHTLGSCIILTAASTFIVQSRTKEPQGKASSKTKEILELGLNLMWGLYWHPLQATLVTIMPFFFPKSVLVSYTCNQWDSRPHLHLTLTTEELPFEIELIGSSYCHVRFYASLQYFFLFFFL